MYLKQTAIYIHFPYCAQRCPYCDFNVHVNKLIPQNNFINAIIEEAKTKNLDPIWKDREISTLFFGGGTPSLFEADQLTRLIEELKKIWIFDSSSEITLEANPEDIDQKYTEALLKAGINRLSLGVQSLQDIFLKKLGRIHSASKAKQAVSDARKAGFQNISIDLMFGLPDQNITDLKTDLSLALELQPDHISYYNLTIEKGTNFYSRQIEGKLNIADDGISADFMEQIIGSLSLAGYEHYEVSNYAKAGKKCLHNMNYWKSGDYLGLGPGAHSAYQTAGANRISHLANISSPERYITNPQSSLAWSDQVEGNKFIFEKIMLRLRLQEDLELNEILGKQAGELLKILSDKFIEFEKEGFLKFSDLKIRLTHKGLMLLDSLLAEIAGVLKVAD